MDDALVIQYDNISKEINRIAVCLEKDLLEVFSAVQNVDRIVFRIKDRQSFITKASKKDEHGQLKYTNPLAQIQDLVGGRIVVYYKTDVSRIVELVTKYYRRIERRTFVPDEVTHFGYEGTHMICATPNTIVSQRSNDLNLPLFFELQIKTLYQHAWSQANHGLGYKPGTSLSSDNQRKLAFLAAQSWGADTILSDIINNNDF